MPTSVVVEVRAHRRHEFLVEAGHQADQAASGALAGQDVHTGGAALERGCLLVEPQAAHLLLRAVAGQQRLASSGSISRSNEILVFAAGGSASSAASSGTHASRQASAPHGVPILSIGSIIFPRGCGTGLDQPAGLKHFSRCTI
jgi:hypothetical protein